MSLFRKPSELEVNPALTAMIYGQPGIGKSTLACSAPSPVLFDFDGGVSRLNGAHQPPLTLQVKRWEDVMAAKEELKTNPEFAWVKSIVIDTAGKMLAYMEEFIKRTQPRMKQGDGSLSLKGFGVRKEMFKRFNAELKLMGKNVIYVAHELEKTRGDETIIRPEVGGSSSNDLIKELDLVAYMEARGKERVLNLDPCDRFYAKNTCYMDGVTVVPNVIDGGKPTGKNDYMSKVIDSYHQRLEDNKAENVKYEALVKEIEERAAAIADAEGANSYFEWLSSTSPVYNSTALGRQALAVRAAELGLKADKKSKKYEDA